MAQPSVTSYFNSRKRSANDDVCTRKSKQIHLEEIHDSQATILNERKIVLNDSITIEAKASPRLTRNSKLKTTPTAASDSKKTTANRRRSCIKRSDQLKAETNQPKIVRFTLAGALSPKKRPKDETTLAALFGSLENVVQKEQGLHTPTKEQQLAEAKAEQEKLARQNISLHELKRKIIRSDRLKDVKESLNKLRAMEESRQKCIKLNGKLASDFEREPALPASTLKVDAANVGANLKKFDLIELEVLSRRIERANEMSLDSIFSGIDDKNLLLAHMMGKRNDTLRVFPSIHNLIKLRRLLIHQRAAGDFRITDVGAILSFMELKELRYFQIANTVHNIHHEAVNRLCHELQLGQLKEKGQLILAKYEWDEQFDADEDEVDDYDSSDEDDVDSFSDSDDAEEGDENGNST